MELREVLRRRRMVRHYTDQPLSDEVVERVLDAALRAPSAGFSQGWAFLALTDQADRQRFWEYVPTRRTQTPTMTDAPLVVVPLAHEAAYVDRYARPDKAAAGGKEWPVPFWYVDTGMAALCMLLTAVDEGLGACLFGIQAEQRAGFAQEFGIPDGYEPVGGITVGYRSAEDAPADPRSIAERRRAKAEVVHRGHWGRH